MTKDACAWLLTARSARSRRICEELPHHAPAPLKLAALAVAVAGLVACDRILLKLLMIKAGGGAEWGVPSMTFDQTEFDDAADGTVRYRHTYPSRNSQVPVGVRSSGALYPFVVVSAVARPGPFLFEVGMRVNQIGFRFDDFEVRPGDQVTRAFAQRRVMMPLLFANVGIKFL